MLKYTQFHGNNPFASQAKMLFHGDRVKEYLDTGKKKIEHSAVTKVPTGAAGKKLQAGGSMAGTMGGMMSGAGVRNPNSGPKLVKKKVKVPMP